MLLNKGKSYFLEHWRGIQTRLQNICKWNLSLGAGWVHGPASVALVTRKISPIYVKQSGMIHAI